MIIIKKTLVALLAVTWAPIALAQTLPSPLVATPTQPNGAANKTYVDTAVSGKLSDAPSDSTVYGRKNGSWFAVPSGSGGLADAPSDGTYYVRRNGAWAVVPGPTGSQVTTALGFTPLGDAPSNSTQYVRQGGQWAAVSAPTPTSTQVVSGLGFTPLNKAGDTLTGALVGTGTMATGINLSGTYTNAAIATSNLKIKGAGSGVENLYTTMPANYFGASGNGPDFSFCVTIAVGCATNASTQPIDGQRAQVMVAGTTQYGGGMQEYGIFSWLHNNKGMEVLWRPSQVYGPGTQNGTMTAGEGAFELDPSITGTCTTGTAGRPTGKSNGIHDGTCIWNYVSDAGGSKTNIGATHYMEGAAGQAWVQALHLVRGPVNDPTTFSTIQELDTSINDGIDHRVGSSYGDVYGIFMNTGGTGIGTAAQHINGPQPPQQGAGNLVTLTTTAGSDTATVSNLSGVYRGALIQLYGNANNTTVNGLLQDETYVGAISGNTIKLVGRGDTGGSEPQEIPRVAAASGSSNIQLQMYGWHIGVGVLGGFTAKDAGFVNSSNSNNGFLNNSNKNTGAGFLDTGGSLGRQVGFQAAGTYSLAAYDSTNAATTYSLRAQAGQKVCLGVTVGCFSYNGSLLTDSTFIAPAVTLSGTLTAAATNTTALTVGSSGISIGGGGVAGISLNGSYTNWMIYGGSFIVNADGSVIAKNIRLTPIASGSLPACNGSSSGVEANITDASGTIGYNQAVIGGGSTFAHIICNGSFWTYH